MKLAIGQIRIQAGNPRKNYESIKHFVEQVKGNANVILFPELSLSGCFVGERNFNESFINELNIYNHKIEALSRDIDIIWGNVLKQEKLFNAVYHASKGKIQAVGTKSQLSRERFEHLYFEPQEKDFTIQLNDVSYTVSLDAQLKDSIHITTETFKHDLQPIFKENTISVKGVGIYNDGGSVYGLNGLSYLNINDTLVSLNDAFVPELKIIDLDEIEAEILEPTKHLLPYIIPIIQMFDEEHLGYKPQWLVGVSGGLDSSVSLALLTMALGKDRIHGITMPGEFTRDITLSNAYHLAKKLGVRFEEMPIGLMVEGTVKSLNNSGYKDVKGLTYENIQARLRGHTLMSVASLVNGVVCNNGNKIETALGYATIYGDAIGALSILGDLTKLEVGLLAQEINSEMTQEIIPKNLIPTIRDKSVEWDFAPSAELSKDQFDPMKWGYHDLLGVYLLNHSVESVLEMYLDDSIYEMDFGQYMHAYGLNNPKVFIDDLEWFVRTLQVATFKRLQTPPILRMSKTGFGLENQMSVYKTETYESLKEAIMKKELS